MSHLRGLFVSMVLAFFLLVVNLTPILAGPADWPQSIYDFKFPFSGVYNNYWTGEIWKITCGYGCGLHHYTYWPHAGTYSIDLVRDDGRSTTGSYVLAPARGRVCFCGWKSGYGWCVEMDHGNGWKSIVAHLNCDPNSFTQVGHDLLQGTLIGVAGNSSTSAPHIHFSIWKNNISVPLGGISGGANIVTYGRYCSGNSFIMPPKGRTTCP